MNVSEVVGVGRIGLEEIEEESSDGVRWRGGPKRGGGIGKGRYNGP